MVLAVTISIYSQVLKINNNLMVWISVNDEITHADTTGIPVCIYLV